MRLSWTHSAAVVVLGASLFVLLPFASAEEPGLKEIELRLEVVQTRKQIAVSEFERGQLLMQNSQMRFRALSEEEAMLQAKIDALKKKSEGK